MRKDRKIFPEKYLAKTIKDIFMACGTPPAEAEIVAAHLVTSNLMGFDSHGIARVPQYVNDVKQGTIQPGTPPAVLKETATTAVIDVGWNFGQVGALRAARAAFGKAKKNALGCVVIRRCRHVGRLGAYTQLAAEQNLLGLAMCSSGREGHRVCPWGGREGRFSPNPISFSAPSGGKPMVIDFSTSAAAEGKIRLMRNLGRKLIEGWLLDGKGRSSTDPNVLYTSPPGVILPAGGSQGYKGFSLALMAEILSNLLGRSSAWNNKDENEANANVMWFLAIDIAAFLPTDEFRREMDKLIAYVKSSALAEGFDEILVPGELEFRELAKRKDNGIPIDGEIWRQIERVAGKLGVTI